MNKEYCTEEDIDKYKKNKDSIVSVVSDKFYGGVVYKRENQIKIIEKIIDFGKNSYERFLEGSHDEIIRRC